MPEIIDVDNVKATEANRKETQKMEEKKDKKLTIKIAKTKPMNNPASSSAVMPQRYQCTEYKNSIPLGIIETITKLTPKYADINPEQLRERLLRSPDIAYLFSQITERLTIENDAVKLLLTLVSHVGNEILAKKLQQEESTA